MIRFSGFSRCRNRLLAYIIAFAMVVSLLPFEYTTGDAIVGSGTVNASKLNVRSEASTSSDVVVVIPSGTNVSITGSVTAPSGDEWLSVSFDYEKKSYKGYVMAGYITVNSTEAAVTTKEAATTKATATTKEAAATKATATTKADATTQAAATKLTSYANINSKAKLYKTTSTNGTLVAAVSKGVVVKASSPVLVGTVTWYKVTTTGLTTNYTGYVQKSKLTFQDVTCDSTTYKLGITKQKSGVYKTANTTDTRLGYIAKKKDVIILGTLTVGGVKWTKVNTSLGEGYMLTKRYDTATATAADKLSYEATVDKNSYARKIASLIADNMGTATKGSKVTVLARFTVNSVSWYKVTFKLDGKDVTGYIRVQYVPLSDDVIFEQSLAKFPDSYQTSLKTLHKAHPAWVFTPVETGLKWSDVIANESKSGKNTIQTTVPQGGTVTTYNAPFSYLSTQSGDYDWSTDTFKVKDGTNWYGANSQVISYYMDPRNFLTEKGIFQFESLSYESTQTSKVTQTMLDGTFMKGNYSVTDVLTKKKVTGSYLDAFMSAAKLSGVSPYYLVSRVRNEVGNNGSNSTSGTYGNYKGYYNFFNIGANDSAAGKAVDNGLKYAKSGTTYERPWTTPYKSIVGGAKYVASQYISLGQNTMYTQKFNVVVASSLYLHQYMTAVTASNSYSLSQHNAYNNNKLLDEAFTFAIPVYKDMPKSACALPKTAGNPNCYLKSLKVTSTANKAFSLNQAFKYTTTSYSLTVANSVKKVNVAAASISSKASVSGTGSKSLDVGDNVITVICTAGNGDVKKYNITITRQKA